MADRQIRYLFRKKETSGSTLPDDGVIAEPFVNTFEGRLFFYGTSGGTYVPVSGQSNVFEVGSNVDYVNAASGITTPYVDFRTGLTNPSLMAGRTFYDQTENALSYYPNTIDMDVELNIGQENLIYVYNNSGNIIYNGQACHINDSYIDGIPTVVLANASEESRFDVSGVATHNIPNGQYGFITNFGIIRNITITGISQGSEIYLSDKSDGDFVYSLNDIEIISRTTKIGRVITTGITTAKILVDIDNEYGFLMTDKSTNSIVANLLSTGIAEFGGLSANTYDNSKFDIGIVKGWVIDNTTDILNPVIKYIYYSGSSESNPSGITLNYLATNPVTYIGITGDTTADIIQSTTPFTNSQWRDIIKLGIIVHTNNTSVVITSVHPLINTNPIHHIYDLMEGLGKFNMDVSYGVEGNIYSFNGTNLKINKSIGKIFSSSSNYLIDKKSPHIKYTPSGTAITFRYRLQDSTEYLNTTNIDPNNYDVNGTLIPVPTNKYTIQRIALFETNLTRIQYGQKLYDTIDEAEASIPFTSFVLESSIAENGLIRGFLIVKQGTTDLTNIKHAKLLKANRFGILSDTIIGDIHYNDIANLKSTGLIEFGGLSANTYDNSKFDIGIVKGWVVDNTSDASISTIKYINFDGDTGLTLTYLSSRPVTYIGISGNTSSDIVQSFVPFTSSQWRDIVKLGVIVHSNNISVVTTNIQPILDLNPVLQVYDLMGGLGKFNVADGAPGNKFSPNGNNLKINKSSGKYFSPGCNYLIDPKNPHIKTLPSISPITFRYRLQNSTEYPNTTDLDPNNYDNGGVLTAVPLNKFTIQRAALFESNLIRWQYGQNLYDSIDDAEASISSENFNVEANIKENGLIRAFVIIKQGTTDLTNTKLAKFVECGRWGLATETVPGNVHRTQILNNSSTGLRNGGYITTASTTTFNVSEGTGIIINNSDANNPIFQEIIWSAQTGITIANITGEVATYIAINNSGTTVQYPFSSPPSQSDKRNNIFLGFIAHSTKTSITNIYNYPIHFVSPVNQHEDLTTSIGPFSINGNQVSAITGTFELQKTAGHSYMYGSDFQSDVTNPSVLFCPQTSGSSTPQNRLVYAKGSEIIGLTSGYTVDYLNYNPGGGNIISPVSNHYFVTHRVWHLPITNLLVWQYGQYEYSTIGDAINNLNTENYISPPSLSSIGYLLAIFIVGEDATSLTQATQNRVIYQSKFAGTGGGGGAIADSLQTAYNNSLQPEILTDSIRGAVTFKNGAGADTLNVVEIQSGADGNKAWITGNGDIYSNILSASSVSAHTLYAHSISGMTPLGINGIVVNDNTISATTYYGDGSHLTGIATAFNGGDVSGETNFTGGLTATSINAKTILSGGTNLLDIFSGGTTVSTSRKHEYQSPYDYCGKAVSNTLETESAWTITRIYIYESGTTSSSTLTNVAWSDHLILNY